MLAAPTTLSVPPIYYHAHKWAILVEDVKSGEWPYDFESQVFAVCVVPECGARLTKDEIEYLLNEAR